MINPMEDLQGERRVLEQQLKSIEAEKNKLLLKEGEIRTKLNSVAIRIHRLCESKGVINANS